MSAAAKQYATGDFSTRVAINRGKFRIFGYDEVDELVQAFNTMAQALASLEMSRRSFVANVSHELKTPMTTIGGFIDGILDGTISEDKEKQYLKVVSDEVKRLSRLVTGMLNMSKIEAGELDLKPQKFDISEMLFMTLLSFEQVIDNKHIEIRGLDTMQPNPIVADKDMINQVVYNLVDNAVKFTPEAGYIEVTSKADAEKIILKIKNSGRGIPDEEIEKIFERFYKVDKSRSYDVKGAGMGLYIIKTIVELHGGHISARSKYGEYAEFIVQLPLN
jgi:signal transduction histidine kinase